MDKILELKKTLFSNEKIMKYSKNSLWAIFENLVSLIVNFVSVIYVARYLGPTDFGTLNFAIVYSSVVGFSIFSFFQILIKKQSEEPENTNKILGSGFFVQSINTLISISLVLISALVFADNLFTVILILIISLRNIFSPFRVIDFYLIATEETKIRSKYTILNSLIFSILKILFVINGFSIFMLAGLYIFDYFMYSVFLIFIYKKKKMNIFDWKLDKDIIIFFIKKSLPFTLIALFSTAALRVDQIILKILLGSESVGIYSVSSRLSEVWIFVPASISIVLFPAINKYYRENNMADYDKKIKQFTILLGTLGVLIASISYVLGPFVISKLYGQEYLESIDVFRIYIWSIISYFIFIGIERSLIVQDRIRQLIIINMSALLLNIISNFYLINKIGITGAAYTSLVSYTLPILFYFILKK